MKLSKSKIWKTVIVEVHVRGLSGITARIARIVLLQARPSEDIVKLLNERLLAYIDDHHFSRRQAAWSQRVVHSHLHKGTVRCTVIIRF